MNILERPIWTLCEALTNFDSSNEKAMTHLNEVLNESDDRYIEKVREYYKQCHIRPSIAAYVIPHTFRISSKKAIFYDCFTAGI